MQRYGTLGLERVGNCVEAQVVVHVGDGIPLQECLLLDRHGGGLLIVIAVVTTHTRVGVVVVVDNTVGPVVEGLLQFAIKDFHEAVGARMVMDGAVKDRKVWQRTAQRKSQFKQESIGDARDGSTHTQSRRCD